MPNLKDETILQDQPTGEIWDDPAFAYGCKLEKVIPLFSDMIPKDFSCRCPDTPTDLIDRDDDNAPGDKNEVVDQKIKQSRFGGMHGRSRQIIGVDKQFHCGNFIETEEVRDQIDDKTLDIIDALEYRKSKTSDPLGKRYFEDSIKLCKIPPDEIARMFVESPHTYSVFSSLIQLPNPTRTKGGAEAERELVGNDLFEAAYGMHHVAIQEILMERERIRLRDSGDKEQEKQFLLDLHKAHEESLRTYERYSEFLDDPQTTGKILGSKISHLVGRGPENTRHLGYWVGIARAENAAIENGWGAQELPIMGVIGLIDAEIRKYEHDGKLADGTVFKPEDIAELKGSFAKLKAECMGTYVHNPEEKLEVARKVEAFLDSYQENPDKNPFVKAAMERGLAYKRAIGQSIGFIKDSYRKQYGLDPDDKDLEFDSDLGDQVIEPTEWDPGFEKMEKLKEVQPLAYLNAVLDEAAKTGDYYKVAGEFAEMEHLHGKEFFKEDDEFFTDKMFTLVSERPEKEQIAVFHQIRSSYIEKYVELVKQTEELAQAIREGRQRIDPDLEPLRRDYNASKIIAAQQLADTPLGRQAKALEAVDRDFFMNAKGSIYDNIMMSIEAEKNNLNGMGLSPGDYRAYRLQIEAYSTKLNDFEIKQDNQNGYRITQMDYDKVTAGLAGRPAMIESYMEDIAEFRATASQQLARLEKLNTGKRSANFQRMLHALEDATKLDVSMTPEEIHETVHRLRTASQAYQEKIGGQKLAAKSSAGAERLIIAGEILEFSVKSFNDLEQRSAVYVNPRERVNEQFIHACEFADQYREFASERKEMLKQEMESFARREQPVQQAKDDAKDMIDELFGKAVQEDAREQQEQEINAAFKAEDRQRETNERAEDLLNQVFGDAVKDAALQEAEMEHELNKDFKHEFEADQVKSAADDLIGGAIDKAVAKEKVNPPQEVASAQQQLLDAQKKNGGKIPPLEEMREPLARITAANELILHKNTKTTQRVFEMQVKHLTDASKTFEFMMKYEKPEDLFKEATTKNGMLLSYSSVRRARHRRRNEQIFRNPNHKVVNKEKQAGNPEPNKRKKS